MIRAVVLWVALLSVPAWAGPNHSEAELKAGAEAHAQILKQLGGEVENPDLSNYVKDVGARVAAVSSMPDAHWRFTVLNTPVINAFALPGGYLYITRGALALANDEAELAAVLGHEIAHVTEGHHADRAKRNRNASIGVIAGAVLGGLVGGKDTANEVLQKGSRFAQGYLAGHSREHEFEADTVAVELLKASGYDPKAMAGFLDSMGDQKRLLAQLAGKVYDPNQVTFFSSHPANQERVDLALENASDGAGARRADDYMAAIDGMIYGDAPREGFVRPPWFVHPELKFAFEIPPGFLVTNSSTKVVASGKNGSAQVFSVARGPELAMDRFIADVWLPRISESLTETALQDLKALKINGLEAAQALLPFTKGEVPMVVVLTAVRHGGLIYLFEGKSRQEDGAIVQALLRAGQSFRALSDAQAAELKPYRIVAYTVQAGDTINMLAGTIPIETRRRERFMILNNFDDGRNLTAGDTIKLILEQ